MPFEQRDMEGALFRNQRRETDKHPNAQGSCTIDGVKYWISAWTNTIRSGDNAGDKYQSLKFKRAEDQPARAAAPQQQAPMPEDDDIPF